MSREIPAALPLAAAAAGACLLAQSAFVAPTKGLRGAGAETPVTVAQNQQRFEVHYGEGSAVLATGAACALLLGAARRASATGRKSSAVATRAVRGLAESRLMAGAPCVKLASGYDMPMVALGTWKAKPGETVDAVKAAVRSGYRCLDCANDYNNENEVGRALNELFEAGEVSRSDLFIQAKLWNTNHKTEHVEADLRQTLEDLGLQYLDSFVIHWPQACPSTGQAASTRLNGAYPAHYSTNPMFPVDDDGYFCSDAETHFVETWQAMEALVDKGLIRSLGLSNFNISQVEEVMACATKPVSILQCECHPYLQQKDLIDFCGIHRIAFQAFSPLGSGETHLASICSPSGVIPLQDPLIIELATKYSKDVGQIMLRWNLQRGICLAAKSVNPARIASNFQLFDWELSAEDMARMSTVNYGWRHLLWRETSRHPDYPFKDELPHKYVLEKAPMESSSGTSA